MLVFLMVDLGSFCYFSLEHWEGAMKYEKIQAVSSTNKNEEGNKNKQKSGQSAEKSLER